MELQGKLRQSWNRAKLRLLRKASKSPGLTSSERVESDAASLVEIVRSSDQVCRVLCTTLAFAACCQVH